MKKGILIVLGMFLMVSAVEAKNDNYRPKSNKVNYSYENSVPFITRGIEFFVFINGDFVMKGTNQAYPPRIKDMRGIALAL